MVGAPKNHAIDAVQIAINSADEVIFFARIGDQGRFKSQYHGHCSVMSYAMNAEHAGKRLWARLITAL